MSVQPSEQLLIGFPATGGRSQELGRIFIDHVFEDLFAEHYPRLVKTLLRLVGDVSQAEELAADAFFRLYRQRPPGSRDNLAGWLYRTAMNLGLDALRSNARRARREDRAGREATLGEKAGGPLQDLLAEEQRARVRTVLAQLKPEHGQALLMNSSGFTCKEMAGVLGVKADSLYVLIGRAKSKFELEYTKRYGRQQ